MGEGREWIWVEGWGVRMGRKEEGKIGLAMDGWDGIWESEINSWFWIIYYG
jgi:hypothetical protein